MKILIAEQVRKNFGWLVINFWIKVSGIHIRRILGFLQVWGFNFLVFPIVCKINECVYSLIVNEIRKSLPSALTWFWNKPVLCEGCQEFVRGLETEHDHGLHLGLVKIILGKLGNVLQLDRLYFSILAEKISCKRGNYLNIILEVGKSGKMWTATSFSLMVLRLCSYTWQKVVLCTSSLDFGR